MVHMLVSRWPKLPKPLFVNAFGVSWYLNTTCYIIIEVIFQAGSTHLNPYDLLILGGCYLEDGPPRMNDASGWSGWSGRNPHGSHGKKGHGIRPIMEGEGKLTYPKDLGPSNGRD